jgi:hypothetical protein
LTGFQREWMPISDFTEHAPEKVNIIQQRSIFPAFGEVHGEEPGRPGHMRPSVIGHCAEILIAGFASRPMRFVPHRILPAPSYGACHRRREVLLYCHASITDVRQR